MRDLVTGAAVGGNDGGAADDGDTAGVSDLGCLVTDGSARDDGTVGGDGAWPASDEIEPDEELRPCSTE
jgi:hypothetical protein